jgi:hypothetical protein
MIFKVALRSNNKITSLIPVTLYMFMEKNLSQKVEQYLNTQAFRYNAVVFEQLKTSPI